MSKEVKGILYIIYRVCALTLLHQGSDHGLWISKNSLRRKTKGAKYKAHLAPTFFLSEKDNYSPLIVLIGFLAAIGSSVLTLVTAASGASGTTVTTIATA